MARGLLARASGQGAVAVGLMLGNVLGYALALFAARRLGPARFGELTALLAVIIVVAVLPTGLQTVVAREVASQVPSRWVTLSRARVSVLAVGAAVILAAPLLLLGRALNASTAATLCAAVMVAPLLVLGWVQGLHQGRERFGRLAVLLALNNGGRALGALVGIVAIPTATGALLGSLLVATVVAALALAIERRPAQAAWPDRSELWAVLQSTLALLALFLCANADVVVARAVLDPVQAGLYAAGSVVTKIAFWLPQFVAVTALPRLVDPARRSAALRSSLWLVGLLGGGIVLGCVVAGDLVVAVIGGDAYASLAPLLPWFACVGGLWAFAQVLLYDALARRVARPAAPLWIALIALLTVGLTLNVTAVGQLVAVATSAAGLGVLLYAATHRLARPQDTEAGQGPGT